MRLGLQVPSQSTLLYRCGKHVSSQAWRGSDGCGSGPSPRLLDSIHPQCQKPPLQLCPRRATPCPLPCARASQLRKPRLCRPGSLAHRTSPATDHFFVTLRWPLGPGLQVSTHGACGVALALGRGLPWQRQAHPHPARLRQLRCRWVRTLLSPSFLVVAKMLTKGERSTCGKSAQLGATLSIRRALTTDRKR